MVSLDEVVWSKKKKKSWKGYKMIGETWRFPRGCGLFHYNKMEKNMPQSILKLHNWTRRPIVREVTKQPELFGWNGRNCGCLDNLSACHRFGLYVWWVAIRKPLLRKANMKSLSLPEDIWLYILALFLERKAQCLV